MILTVLRIVLECCGVLYVLLLFGVTAVDLKDFVVHCAIHLRKLATWAADTVKAVAEKRRHQRELDLVLLKRRLQEVKSEGEVGARQISARRPL